MKRKFKVTINDKTYEVEVENKQKKEPLKKRNLVSLPNLLPTKKTKKEPRKNLRKNKKMKRKRSLRSQLKEKQTPVMRSKLLFQE